ncbi:MAG TPA: tetratricopeptide repeat protein [Saprospiraceae bacterium]|nr:tetratricopeptide repeat protein [Saprospiraceae bacterium]
MAMNFCFTVSAQQTEVYTDAQHMLRAGDDFYASGLFSQAFNAYDEATQLLQPIIEPQYELLKRDVVLGKAKSALRMDHPEGERLMLDFILTHRPDAVSNSATIELADFYFNSGDYEKAISYFSMLYSPELNAEMLSEVRFKHGYSYFVRKEFTPAEAVLGEVRELRTVYHYPVNYYYGMCKFFKEDYEGALVSFEKVAQSEKYRDFAPYYITQIYFARGEYEKVITYAEPKLSYAGLKNKEDMRLLLGRAYFETENYTSALPHLHAYATQVGTMRAEDFYQLAFAQYQSGDYTSASENFKHVASQENLLGQRANFYLADCYLKTGDLQSARTAFRNVSKMTFDETLREEALLQFGKVSAQLNYDAEAIQALDAIPATSPWREEAQKALRDVFYHTRDYVMALSTLESFSTLSPTLKEAYQQVSLHRGIQLMQDGKVADADQMFAQVQTYPIRAAISAQALFWRAEIAHTQLEYERSADFLRQYFTIAKTVEQLPVESSLALGQYTQGYNYLGQKNYAVAQGYFLDAISLLKLNRTQYAGQYQRTVLPDALVRAGDCAFKRNMYGDARRLYNEAIPLGGSHMIYAKYQRAMIEGLERKPESKIRDLEGMVIDHPESDFADDVLLQLGMTYQETNKSEQAIAVLKKLLDKYPHSDLFVTALLRLGLISYNSGDIDGAMTHYKRVFKHQPTASEGREALSALEEIYVTDLKKPDAYFEFVASVPGYEISAMKKDSVSYRVAEIQYEQSEYASAIKAFTEYLQRFPKGISVTSAYFFRGDAHAVLNQYSEALSDFETVVARGPGAHYLDALNRASLLTYHHTRDFQASYRHYQKLYELLTDQEKRFEAMLGMLRSAYRAGLLAETLQWSDALTKHPLASEMIRAEAYFYGAKAAFEKTDYAEARDRFNEVIKVSQNEQGAEARYRVAQIYYFDKQPDMAERFCHDANEKNANYPYWVAKSLILLSDIAVEKNDLFNAKAPLEAVIENFQGDATILQEAQQKLDTIYVREKQESRILQDTGKVLQLQFMDDGKKD